MLVGRGMEDHRRRVGSHDLVHPLLVGDIGDQRLKRGHRLHPGQLLLDEKQRVFGPLDEQERFRQKAEHLPADL